MRLADFIDSHLEDILREWEAFAATRLPAAAMMDALALRDHAPQILGAMAEEIRQPQTIAAQQAKSHGLAAVVQSAAKTAAEVHGALRARDGFSLKQLVSEYRALRASVVRLWGRTDRSSSHASIEEDMIRFHEAIDQALAESVDFVKRLIDMHGGQVRAFSRGEGLGSTFEIQLPCVVSPSAGAAQVAPATPASKRILLVDDNVDAAESLSMLLQMQGHVLLAVHSAYDALGSIAWFKPEVVLIDIGLPGMDGYALVEQLGKLTDAQAVRKIALTGYGQPEDKQRALDVGFDAHLVKPVNATALAVAIAPSS